MKALVTGGGGFLGGAIVRKLVERGDSVRSISRGHYPELAALGVEAIRGDITNSEAITAACRDIDVVFHVAAKPGIWGDYHDFFNANVIGTESVLLACRSAGVSRLVYTSSPSVVFDGRDMEGADESAPYSSHHESHYSKTKAEAEKLVLRSNDDALATVALRPHLIWGPGDNHLIPRILARAARLRVIGDGSNKVDAVFVANAADAHILAAERLRPGAAIAGRSYFITNGEPVPLWWMVNRILLAAGKPPVTRRVSAGAAHRVGGALEFIYRSLRLKAEPPLTRFVAREMATAHWFDITAARRDLGYEPRVDMEEGFRLLEQWLDARPDLTGRRSGS